MKLLCVIYKYLEKMEKLSLSLNTLHFNTYHTFSVIHSRQILLKLFAHIEVHIVVLEGAEGFDDNVVAVVHNVLVGLEQGGNFPDCNIHICNRFKRRAVTTL